MSKKKVQLSTRWPRQIYDLAVTVAIKERRSVGWVLTEWAIKGARAEGYPVPNSPVSVSVDEIEDGR